MLWPRLAGCPRHANDGHHGQTAVGQLCIELPQDVRSFLRGWHTENTLVVAMASNLLAMVSTLVAMASMVSTLVAMASNLLKTKPGAFRTEY